jgi:histidinol-phosphate aminotransferase
MSRFWSDVVKGLTPYVPGEQPKLANLVKLNTNENPYGRLAAGAGRDPRRATDASRLRSTPTRMPSSSRLAGNYHWHRRPQHLRRQRLG